MSVLVVRGHTAKTEEIVQAFSGISVFAWWSSRVWQRMH
jgi:hypothetical protein